MKVKLLLMAFAFALVMAFSPSKPQPSCAQATTAIAAACEAQEALVRKTSVRVTMFLPSEEDCELDCPAYNSQATLVAGCQLLTHRHFGLMDEAGNVLAQKVALFDVDGRLLAVFDPSEITVSAQTAEAQLLSFADGAHCPLDALDLTPTPMAALAAPQLRKGTELATVLWDRDRKRSEVRWVRVLDVSSYEGQPVVELDVFLPEGNSGAGLFWHGHHVGNVWYRAEDIDRNGVVRRYSAAALNLPALLADLD